MPKVKDGDTFDFVADQGFGNTKKDTIRLSRVNAYETKLYKKYGVTPKQKALGLKAKACVKKRIEGKIVHMITPPGLAGRPD